MSICFVANVMINLIINYSWHKTTLAFLMLAVQVADRSSTIGLHSNLLCIWQFNRHTPDLSYTIVGHCQPLRLLGWKILGFICIL